jgi:hypothetical protein
VYWDQGRGDNQYDYLSNTLGYVAYTADSFTPGLWYTFRVTAVNAIGEGPYSQSIAILAAEVPDAPTVPTLMQQTET